MASASSSATKTSTANGAATKGGVKVDDGLESVLKRQDLAVQKETEIERILKAFKLNPYEILDLEHLAAPDAIKRKYRQLSLFIHPDKTPDPRAPDAFDILKKAEAELSDEKKREALDAALRQARIETLKDMDLPTTIANDDYRLEEVMSTFKQKLRVKSKQILMEEEARRRLAIKVNLANEGTEQRMKEAEVSMKKRKAEEDARWEENRESRVGSWRTFSGKPKKKKKTTVLLG